MPDEMSQSANASGNNASAIASGAAVAGALAAKVQTVIYEKLTGDAYSEEEKKRLAELKRLYQESFQISAPVTWDLDNNDKPTFRIKRQKWSLYVQQIHESKHLAGNYHYQTHLITEYASSYLIGRGDRWLAGGKQGDLIEQFIGDWINFALNDLPTLGFDDESVKKIKKRIAYIEQVQKHESIFQFGAVTRAKNKFDTIESIKRQLISCVDKAAQESYRQCAREKFNICRADIEALLLSCAHTMYYARKTNVCNEPLELASFINPEENFLTVSAKKIYPEIKLTHTGSMLVELASIAGLRSFGLPDQDEILGTRNYFNKDGKLKPVIWDSLKSDLPPWVTADTINTRLSEFQAVGGSLIRVANLKKLIEDAYDLTGKVGDLWAYGDKQGKLSLKALLFILEKEVNLLKLHFDTLYKHHNKRRHAYNLEKRINPNAGINPNFNKVDAQKMNIDKLYISIINASQSIREQMSKFPENASKRIDEKKRGFYKSIFQYLKQFYPETYAQYQLIGKVGEGSEYPYDVDSCFDFESQESNLPNVSSKEILLTWPIKTDPQYNYHYLDKPYFKPYVVKASKARLPATWLLGNNYDHWIKGYFTYNQVSLSKFQALAKTLQKLAKNPETIDEVNTTASALQNAIKNLCLKVEAERPKWRFKWGLWPIKTKGWPFNRDAATFAGLLLKEFDVTSKCISASVKLTKEKMNSAYKRGEQNKQPEKTNPPSTSLTKLDQEILNAIRDPKRVEEAATQFSDINQSMPANNASINSANKNRDIVNQWFDKIKACYQQLSDGIGKFQVLSKRNDAIEISNTLLEYRDQLSGELLQMFIDSWGDLSYLLNMEMKYPGGSIDKESVDQMQMIIKLISILKTEPNSNERTLKLSEFINEYQSLHSKWELSLATQSYMRVGLMPGNTNAANNSQQQAVKSPTAANSNN